MSKRYPTPTVPLKAHHRVIRKILDTSFPNKIEHRVGEYELINQVFKKAGGSWEAVFLGDLTQIILLKKILKVAFKKRILTRRDSWTS